MNKKKKIFAIYCSGSASRIIKFYSTKYNLNRYAPVAVIYDGKQSSTTKKLKDLFKKNLIEFNEFSKGYDRNRPHGSTSEFIHSIMKKNNIDFLLCFGGKILKPRLINEYKYKLINFHPSILPSFKGLAAIDQALAAGVNFLGNTVHFIDEGLDTGEIILQSAMYRTDYENYEDVLEMQLPMIKIILRDKLNYIVAKEEIFSDIPQRSKEIFIPKKCR